MALLGALTMGACVLPAGKPCCSGDLECDDGARCFEQRCALSCDDSAQCDEGETCIEGAGIEGAGIEGAGVCRGARNDERFPDECAP